MIQPATTPPLTPAMTYAAVVGKVVERLRKQRRITQGQLAEVLGIGQPAYSRLEQGQSTMNVIQLGQVAAQLGTTPADILKEADEMATRLRAAGVDITSDKVSTAAVLIGLAVLAALFAAIK